MCRIYKSYIRGATLVWGSRIRLVRVQLTVNDCGHRFKAKLKSEEILPQLGGNFSNTFSCHVSNLIALALTAQA